MTALDDALRRMAGWRHAAWVRWLWRLGGSALAILVLGFGTVQVVVVLAHEEHTTIDSYEAAGLEGLVVHSESGDVRVVGSDVEAVRVTAQVSDGLVATDHEQQIVDDRLVITTDCPEVLSAWCEVDYRIEVPRRFAVDVRTEAGHIAISGLDGAVTAGSDASGVEVDALSGPVALDSDAGSLSGTNLRSTSVTASTSHGRVSLGFAEPPRSVSARTSHGSIEVVVPDDGSAYRIDASSDHGSVETPVPTDPSSDLLIVATTSHGDIDVRH